jgi:autotransporter-associated beta strand protein
MKSSSLFSALFLCAFLAPAMAAPLSWDPAQTPATPSGGNGTWNLADAFWSDGAANQAWTDTVGLTDTAGFGGSAGTVAVGGALAAKALVFNTPGYTLAGGSLALGGGGIDASALASGTTTVGSDLLLVESQTWSAGAGATLAVNGALARGNGATLALAGGGAWTTTSLANTNGILGPWALISSTGAAANNSPGGFTYATISGGSLVPYLDATPLAGTGAWGGIPSGGDGTINYDLGSAGDLGWTGLGRNIHTLRYTGAGATQQANFGGAAGADIFTASGIVNAGTGALNIGSPATGTYNGLNITIGTGHELVLGAMTANLVLENIIRNNGANPGAVTVTGAASVVFGGANTFSGGLRVHSGKLVRKLGGTLGTGPVFLDAASTLTLEGGGHTMAQAVSGGGQIVNTVSNTVTGDWSGFTGTYTHNSTTVSSVFNTASATSAGAAYVLASAQGSAQGMIAAGAGDYTLQIGSLTGVADSLFRGGNAATGTTTLEIGALDADTTFAGIDRQRRHQGDGPDQGRHRHPDPRRHQAPTPAPPPWPQACSPWPVPARSTPAR